MHDGNSTGGVVHASVPGAHARIAESFGRLSAFFWSGLCVNPAPVMRALMGPVEGMAGVTHEPQNAAAAVREMRLSDSQVLAGEV